jgi:hypothetical protein
MILFLLALAAATKPPVVVSSLTTRQLAEDCRGKDTDSAATFCTGYIMGVFDTLSSSRQICPSTDIQTIDAVAAARKYIRKHSKTWGNAPSFVVRDGLRDAFPCGLAPDAETKSPPPKRKPARKRP